jgi:hypothetical protein
MTNNALANIRTCDVCGKTFDTNPIIFPNGDEIKLCKEHAEDIFRSLKEQNSYTEKEIVGFNKTIMIIAVIGILSGIFMFVPIANKEVPSYLSGLPYIGFVLGYIISFASPSIYKRVLQIGTLKQMSVVHRVRQLESRDIIQIDATVIAGALVLLTLSSSLGVGGYLAHLLGIQASTVIVNATGTIVVIFASSAIAVSIFRYTEIGRRIMVAGFVYLFFVMLILTFFIPTSPTPPPLTIAEQCAIKPENFSMTHAVADCSKFTPGSLAQDCALNPITFHVELKQCSKFITSEKGV